MKTFCEVCTANPATVVCCADDAVMCSTCDQRCAREAGNTANERGAETAFLSSRFASAAGPLSRDATGDEARGRLASTRVSSLCLANARSIASRPGTDPRALPRLPFIRPAPAASTPPTPWSPSTSASRSVPTPGPCATSARCARPRIDEKHTRRDDRRLAEAFARSRGAPRAVAGASLRDAEFEARKLRLRFLVTETPRGVDVFNENASGLRACFSRG